MNSSDRFRQTARNDSRRFAKGVQCFIVHEPEIINLMYETGIIPTGIRLNAGPSDKKYFDAILGKFFVIGKVSQQRYNDSLKSYSKNVSTQLADPSKEYGIDELSVIKNYKQQFSDFLRQVVVMITIPSTRLPDGKIPSPDVYDVIIETQDLNQTTDCIFITQKGQFRDEATI